MFGAAPAATTEGAVTGMAGEFPKRFAVVFMGNGINANHWWAKGQGAEMKLGKSLQPLEPLKHKINVINNLFNQPAVGKGIHPGQTGNLLSGVPIQQGAIVKGGITMDQVLANHLGQDTPHASMVLACWQPATDRLRWEPANPRSATKYASCRPSRSSSSDSRSWDPWARDAASDCDGINGPVWSPG